MGSPRIIIQCVAPEAQRLSCYQEEYSGDWFFDDNGDININVTGNNVWLDPEAFLVALHELVEARLCHEAGIDQSSVDTFDLEWNKHGEPGDDVNAPYCKEHRQACLVEFLVASFMRIYNYGTMR